jgi:hypothetical protein
MSIVNAPLIDMTKTPSTSSDVARMANRILMNQKHIAYGLVKLLDVLVYKSRTADGEWVQ